MHTQNRGPRSAPIRILAVTVAACGFLFAPRPALAGHGRAGDELAQPARKTHHSRPSARPAEGSQAPAAAPAAKPPAEESAPDGRPSEQEAKPDDDEEVSPGESPDSCDGCELAGFGLAGSLWGLFGFSRRRGGPRTVIRGLQPR